MRVQNRHIIYVQGYDPRGLAQYYRMFRTELRKFGRLYEVSTTISRPRSSGDDEIASWSIETKADDWQTRTHSDFLRTRRRQEAEERAGKVGVKLVFPIFFFILPSMMIVAAGPGILQIFKYLFPMMKNL